MKHDIYAEVTARILAELEKGALPWVRPWAATPGANTPCNAVTGRPYSGTNVILLFLARSRGWPTPRFLTFKQARDAGGTVNAGEHGTQVAFVKKLKITDRETKEDKIIPLMKAYTVFNVAQCSGLSDRIVNGAPFRVRNPDTRDELADSFIEATGARITEGSDRAFYTPSIDAVTMPAFATFKNADNFYAVMFHELTHWTGAKSRCDRDLKNRFGDKGYAAEELVAELGSAFLCAEFAFDGEVRDAGYIQNWIALLKDNDKAFFSAASAAQKAVDFLRGLVAAEEVDQVA